MSGDYQDASTGEDSIRDTADLSVMQRGESLPVGALPLETPAGYDPTPRRDWEQESERVSPRDPVLYNSNKSLGEIEQDIAGTRAELSETLDALEQKLAPRQLMEKGVDMVRDSMNENFGQISESVIGAMRAHPVSVALIGAGISWLALSQTGATRRLSAAAAPMGDSIRSNLAGAASRAGEYAGGVVDRVKEATGMSSGHGAGEIRAERDWTYAYARTKSASGEPPAGVSGRAFSGKGSAVQSATNRVTAAGSAAYQQAGALAGRAAGGVGSLGRRLADAMEENPLAVGALAMIAGATIAMLLPGTPVEEEYLGETRDRLLDQAQELGNKAIDRAGEIAGAAVEAASDAVRREVT